jgi:hypothetical protein
MRPPAAQEGCTCHHSTPAAYPGAWDKVLDLYRVQGCWQLCSALATAALVSVTAYSSCALPPSSKAGGTAVDWTLSCTCTWHGAPAMLCHHLPSQSAPTPHIAGGSTLPAPPRPPSTIQTQHDVYRSPCGDGQHVAAGLLPPPLPGAQEQGHGWPPGGLHSLHARWRLHATWHTAIGRLWGFHRCSPVWPAQWRGARPPLGTWRPHTHVPSPGCQEYPSPHHTTHVWCTMMGATLPSTVRPSRPALACPVPQCPCQADMQGSGKHLWRLLQHPPPAPPRPPAPPAVSPITPALPLDQIPCMRVPRHTHHTPVTWHKYPPRAQSPHVTPAVSHI